MELVEAAVDPVLVSDAVVLVPPLVVELLGVVVELLVLLLVGLGVLLVGLLLLLVGVLLLPPPPLPPVGLVVLAAAQFAEGMVIPPEEQRLSR